jgi:hypothetical protein
MPIYLARLGDDGTEELVRTLSEQALQDLLNAEPTAHIGSPSPRALRVGVCYRSGRPRLLSTPARRREADKPNVRVAPCSLLLSCPARPKIANEEIVRAAFHA